jgi:hypothetical protein
VLIGQAGVEAGYHGLAAGDVNGDAFADIVIGAPFATIGANGNAGAVYVVFGGATGANNSTGTAWNTCTYSSPCTLNAAFLNGTNGAEFDGAGANYRTGWSLAVGDLNGDGKGDLAIGAYGALTNTGSVYVVFGKSGAWSGTATLLNSAFLNGTNGAEFDGGTTNYQAGRSVAIGDINGDGKGDLVIGELMSASGGSAFVVWGKAAPWSGTASVLSTTCVGHGCTPFINVTNGIELDGTAVGSYTGFDVAVGDVNGDGKGDILIGAPNATISGVTNAGSLYVVFGNSSGSPSYTPEKKDGTAWAAATTLNSTLLNGTNGAEFDGASNVQTGWDLTTADVNGDGISDIITGGSNASTGGLTNNGSVYFIFGKAAGWSGTATKLNAAFLNGANGIEVDGAASGDFLSGPGHGGLAAGDINGAKNGTHPLNDIVMGAPDHTVNGQANAGAIYIINGQTSGWTTPQQLSGP